MIDCFARVTHGLETLAANDLHTWAPVEVHGLAHRIIRFGTTAKPEALLKIPTLDDLFIELGQVRKLTHERQSLQLLKSSLPILGLPRAIETCRKVRNIDESPRFSVTASFLGSRNYTRWDLAGIVREVIEKSFKWDYLDARNPLPPHDLHFRLHLEDNYALFGLRLGQRPLHHRNYKSEHIPGSLSPPVAAVLATLVDLPRNAIMLDPTAGCGTVLCEYALRNPECNVVGVELEEGTLSACVANSKSISPQPLILRGDSTHLPLNNNSVDVIVANFPWGHESSITDVEIEKLYPALVKECTRVLRPKREMIVITDCHAEFQGACSASTFEEVESYSLSLRGSHPTIYRMALKSS